VGWLPADRESHELAEKLLGGTIAKQDIDRDRLTIHSDNGPSMASKPVAALLIDLGVTKSHSRPHTSNDNPYSESGFRTMKYRPDFPDRFGSEEEANAHCRKFFRWYNHEHFHSRIGWRHPVDVHYGRTDEIAQARAETLSAAYARHPERFVRKHPTPAKMPDAAWINKPTDTDEEDANDQD